MFPPSKQRVLGRLCVLSALLLCVSAEKVFESRPGIIQELRATLADLAGEGRSYLGRLAGEQTVLSVQKVRGSYQEFNVAACGSLRRIQ